MSVIERTYIFQQSRAELAALIEPQLFEAIHNSEQFRSPLPGRWQFGLVNNEMFVDLRLALDGPGVLHAIHDDGLIEFHYRATGMHRKHWVLPWKWGWRDVQRETIATATLVVTLRLSLTAGPIKEAACTVSGSGRLQDTAVHYDMVPVSLVVLAAGGALVGGALYGAIADAIRTAVQSKAMAVDVQRSVSVPLWDKVIVAAAAAGVPARALAWVELVEGGSSVRGEGGARLLVEVAWRAKVSAALGAVLQVAGMVAGRPIV
ncbi:hypothetical protein CHLRE_06g271750v5 [Chlamydomonas reinhardtii]|uniref:Uncharacterized protein n=1 Tax=Chlamydomonas reinhardtii TaxID=3055 RepID=A0A2K3DNF6_CHLRE|nr:uncharacterized protein CHLRE_06g271750v5 [Chlamydomonas reinhardtii]PNW82051.1 hypothetical protein CHLRE_06g271750v5 [Chlamydomonas reinhardtii]